MTEWTESIYSDGTGDYVSNPIPELKERITISVRLYEDAPVDKVLLFRIRNGAEEFLPMEAYRKADGFCYYRANTDVNEPRIQYHFVFICEDRFLFYTQEGVKPLLPDYKHDFVLLAGYRRPEWIEGSVMYQIFPERFRNGDTSNDVKDGEISYMGHESIQMKDWRMAPLCVEDAHGMDFFGGDLDGIRDKLPYLKELGIKVIYLNPIFVSNSTHKYDCNDYYHVDEHFGGDEALAHLSESIHELGMKLILDISVNHTGIEHVWVKSGKDYYQRKEDGSLKCWWDVPTLPALDYRKQELRDLIYEGDGAVLRKWLREPYNIDGWRFDVADVMAKNDEYQLEKEVWQGICRAIHEEKADAMIIGEHWSDCSEYLQGDMWNTPMNYYGFGRLIRRFLGLEDLFLSRNKDLAKLSHRIDAGQFVRLAQDHYSVIPWTVAECQMNLFDSHDIPRIHNYPLICFEQWKCAVIAQLMWIGIPCIYYGDEKGIDGHIISDAGCRYPMPWDDDSGDADKFYMIYSKMARLRGRSGAFARGSRKVLLAEGNVLAIARFTGDEKYVCVISSDEDVNEVCIPLKPIGAHKCTETVDEFGGKPEIGISDGSLKIRLKPYDSYVLRIN